MIIHIIISSIIDWVERFRCQLFVIDNYGVQWRNYVNLQQFIELIEAETNGRHFADDVLKHILFTQNS